MFTLNLTLRLTCRLTRARCWCQCLCLCLYRCQWDITSADAVLLLLIVLTETNICRLLPVIHCNNSSYKISARLI